MTLGREQLNHELQQFENQVWSTFKDKVSVEAKAKGLIKWGVIDSLGTSRETVWSVGGDETFVTTNIIDEVVSSDASDTQEIVVEGHTVTGTGTDSEFTFVVQKATLNGQTEVVLTTPLARVNRIYNNDSTDLAGTVYAFQGTSTVTAGVPQDATKIHCTVPIGNNQSEKCATTISNLDYWCITEISVSVQKKQTADVDFFVEIRLPGKVFREYLRFSGNNSTGTVSFPLDPALIVPKNSDVRVRAAASTTGVEVSAALIGYLARVMPN